MNPFTALWRFIVNLYMRKGLVVRRFALYVGVTQGVINLWSRRYSHSGNLRIVDIGCGGGELLLSISDIRGSITGIGLDLDLGSLIKARQTAANKGSFSVDFTVADADGFLPFRDSSFDVVLAFSILEHLANVDVVVSEIGRILRPCGVAIVQLPNLDYFIEPHTNMPFPFLMPSSFKESIRTSMGYAYINWKVRLKYVKSLFEGAGLQEVYRTKVYHGNIKTYPWPAGFISIFQKPCIVEAKQPLK